MALSGLVVVADLDGTLLGPAQAGSSPPLPASPALSPLLRLLGAGATVIGVTGSPLCSQCVPKPACRLTGRGSRALFFDQLPLEHRKAGRVLLAAETGGRLVRGCPETGEPLQDSGFESAAAGMRLDSPTVAALVAIGQNGIRRFYQDLADRPGLVDPSGPHGFLLGLVGSPEAADPPMSSDRSRWPRVEVRGRSVVFLGVPAAVGGEYFDVSPLAETVDGRPTGLNCFDCVPRGFSKHLVVQYLIDTGAITPGRAIALGDSPLGNDEGLTRWHDDLEMCIPFVSVCKEPLDAVSRLRQCQVTACSNARASALVLDALYRHLTLAGEWSVSRRLIQSIVSEINGCISDRIDELVSQLTESPLAHGFALLGCDVLPAVVRRLPVHPRCFAMAAVAGRELAAAVAAVRQELGCEACEAHGLESARGKAAGKLLVELVEMGATAEALRLVVAGAPLDLQDRRHTALMEAACKGHIEAAVALVEAGAGLDLPDGCGTTALMWTAIMDHTKIMEMLIGARASLDLQEDMGQTALMIAAEFGRTEEAEMLIGAGARLDLRYDNGETALIMAALGGHTEVVEVLIGAGARLDLQARDGCTALMVAARSGETEVVKVLIGAGARLDLQDLDGDTALTHADCHAHPEIVAALQAAAEASRCLVLVKAGGSALTVKSKLETLRPAVLSSTAHQISQPTVLVHGAGSFGHFQAKEFETRRGGRPEDWQAGLARVRRSVCRLNMAVLAELEAAGLAAVGVSPFPGCKVSAAGAVREPGPLGEVSGLLKQGLVPVLHGDALLCAQGEAQPCSILSGDGIMIWLAEQAVAGGLGADRVVVVFLTDVAGVYDRPPADPAAQLVPCILVEPDGKHELAGIRTETAAQDVTGGIAAKIEAAAEIARLGLVVYIVEAGTEHAEAALAGKRPAVGTEIRLK